MSEVGNNSKQLIKAMVERIERLDEEIKGLNDDKRDVYAEAKGSGLDTKALKEVIRLRRQDPDVRREQQNLVELYMSAVGTAA